MNPAVHASPACQSRSALAAAERHQSGIETAERIREDVLSGLAGFTDSFMDALGGDFLAEADERRLRERHRNQPAVLAARLSANRRALSAQRALHVLYNKLLTGAAMTVEEQALAQHARDLVAGHAEREIERRCQRSEC